jgi:TRAP-type C4-dicarboxylate transport system permease small subunit
MEVFLGRYAGLVDRIGRIERILGIILMALIVGCIFGQVVSRYFFGLPLVWVEELSTYAFIWCVFIGASLGLKKDRHIKILSFVSRLPWKKRFLFQGAANGLIALFCLLLTVNGFQAMFLLEWNQRTIALPVELPRYLFYSLPLIVGTFSMSFTAIHNFASLLAATRQTGPGKEESLL